MKKPFKLRYSHLTVSKPLPWDVYDTSGQLLLSHGFVIENESQLESLLARGMYVDAADLEASVRKARPEKYLDPFWVWDDLVAKLAYQLAHPSRQLGFVQRISDLGRQVQSLGQRSADATIAIIMLSMDTRRYATVHSLQVAALCDLVAKRLNWATEHRSSLVCAALTMNIGMHDLQQQLANQSAALTPEQQALVKEHPERGVNILAQAGVDAPQWLAMVENHHETANGTGYPQAIRMVDEATTLLRTIDVYCAKISPRLHRKPMSGTQAERVLFTDAGLSSDNPFIPALIKEIGIYPPGSFVKLINGELAIVCKRSSSINAPHVLSLINDKGNALMEPIRRDTSRDIYKIGHDVERDSIAININPEKIWCE